VSSPPLFLFPFFSLTCVCLSSFSFFVCCKNFFFQFTARTLTPCSLLLCVSGLWSFRSKNKGTFLLKMDKSGCSGPFSLSFRSSFFNTDFFIPPLGERLSLKSPKQFREAAARTTFFSFLLASKTVSSPPFFFPPAGHRLSFSPVALV